MPTVDYQPGKRHNKYWLEPTRHKLALAFVRQYPRLCSLRNDILHGSTSNGDHIGAPKGVRSDPTAVRGMRLARIDNDITIIEKALDRIPKEYRNAVLDNVLYRISRDALEAKYHLSETTVQRYRAKLLWEVANLAGFP